MGINAEMVQVMLELRREGELAGARAVIELGAQDVAVEPEVVAALLAEQGIESDPGTLRDARGLYALFGFETYRCIDAAPGDNALTLDLNLSIGDRAELVGAFDLVTNLGTSEHCFDQQVVFRNVHDLCRPGGLMIHALPAAGNVNHGFYNYHPRFFAELAFANRYDVRYLGFTTDYAPNLVPYTLASFRACDDRDVLLYAVMRRSGEDAFRLPFDGMFSQASALEGYTRALDEPLSTDFAPYLKTGNWANTRGVADGSRASGTGWRGWIRRFKGWLTA